MTAIPTFEILLFAFIPIFIFVFVMELIAVLRVALEHIRKLTR